MKCDGTNSAGANCQITPKHFHIFDVAFILAVIRVMKLTYIARFHNARIQNNTVIEFVRQHTLNLSELYNVVCVDICVEVGHYPSQHDTPGLSKSIGAVFSGPPCNNACCLLAGVCISAM